MTPRPTAKAAAWAGIALVVALTFVFARTPQCASAQPQSVRPAGVAGMFYPSLPEPLGNAVKGFLKGAEPAVPAELRDFTPRALIVPHAGYVYSGPTAGFAYKLWEGQPRPDRVILLGPPHSVQLLGACSVADFSAYETPLGRLTVDAEARAELAQREPFHSLRLPHEREHCLEVQLPFLQTLWPDPPKIVPVLVGDLNPAQCRAAAEALAGIIDERTLVVVSTDFTHYGTRFGFAPFGERSAKALKEQIRELDMGAVKLVEALDPAGFRGYVSRRRPTICGRKAVEVMLELFSRYEGSRPVFLRWASSGDRESRYDDCVSYVAMAVYTPPGPLKRVGRPLGQQTQNEGASRLTRDEKRTLLRLARESVTQAVKEQRVEQSGLDELPERLHEDGAAFVTLTRRGQLRGCIGHVEPDRPLCVCVCQMAALAALRDPRFAPVQPEELEDLRIEISILTPLEAITDPKLIRIGRDGLVVKGKEAQGLLLPQVAAERGWTVTEFLQETCRKAGLPPDAWEDRETNVYRFQADVFSEDDFEGA